MSLPKFDFSKATIKTSDALEKTRKESGETENTYFNPGNYELVVEAVEHQGPAGDPTWHKFLLKCGGVGGKKINKQVMVPTADLVYLTKDGEKTTFIFAKYQKVMEALSGIVVTPENVAELTSKYFGNLKSLVGLRFQAVIGYDGNHVRYEGKDEAGNKRYVIALKSGATVNGSDGQPLVFSDWASASEYAVKTAGLELKKFTDILEMSKSTSSKPKAVSNW